jgi:signal transduction histidine kinase
MQDISHQVSRFRKPLSAILGTVKGRLILLLIAVLLPIFLVQAGTYYHRFQAERDQENETNLEIARAIAVSIGQFIQDVSHQELSIGLALTAGLPPPPQEVERLLVKSKDGHIAVRDFSWTDAHGRVIASSLPNAVGLDISDRPYFRKASEEQEAIVSDLIIDRPTREPIFTISRGFRDEGGNLLGVVVAAVEPRRLDEVLIVERGRGGTISLVDRKGMIVDREPYVALPWKRRFLLERYPKIHDGLRGEEATFTSSQSLDGIERMEAVVPIRSIGWVVKVGRPVEAVVAPLVASLSYYAGWFLFVTAAAIGFALFISRKIAVPIRALRDQALALGRGESNCRVEARGMRELEDLADSFNVMAKEIRTAKEGLEQRVAERTIELERANAILSAHAHELEMLNTELKEFAFVAAHDLKEPLRKIQTFSTLMKKRCVEQLNEQGAGYLSRIEAVANRMQRSLEALLTYSRIVKGPENLKSIDLNKVAEDAENDLALLIRQAHGQVSHTALPSVKGDYGQLRELFRNLIANAITFRRSDTDPVIKIHSRAKKENGRCEIIFEDNGIGFDEKYLDRIFKPFKRLHGPDDYEGIGMGLAICRKIVERHGGDITARSNREEGCTFIVTLPLQRENHSE